jgi:3-hydroxyisobutyrate dehydrogenase-like beta-hydroxyacid dehydrogenase
MGSELVMVMDEGTKVEAAAFGFPAQVRPGTTRVGWIGIGVMGGAMATRLLAAGFAVTAYARTPAKAKFLSASGATIADSSASVAAASDVVFIMVSNPADVRAVVLDAASGALAGLRPGGVLVDCTSSSPSLAREIAAAARSACCYAVDSPVSGGDVGAREGTLAILAGGDVDVVAWLAPLFAHLGRSTRWNLAVGFGAQYKF